MDKSIHKYNNSKTSKGHWQMLIMETLLWHAKNILGMSQNSCGECVRSGRDGCFTRSFLTLPFCTFPINKQMFQLLFVYTWFVNASGSNSNEGEKKKSPLFLNKMLPSKTKVFSHFSSSYILFSLIIFW